MAAASVRFEVGTAVMCNLGPSGWKLGRVIALRYREDHWPAGREAPYQVALEESNDLIFVPHDDVQCCREPTPEDLRIACRTDALATLPEGMEGEPQPAREAELFGAQLGGADGARGSSTSYRSGRCHCCDGCPRAWSCAEMYSEHYRCAARNGLRVTQRVANLGTVRVGSAMQHAGSGVGFMQCPTLVRLPPGVRFTDDGALAGVVRFDPFRAAKYEVEFVAVSTAGWEDAAVGIVRLEITFVVEANEPPAEFDAGAFVRERTGG